jgi:hypothetical protein
MEDSIEIVNPSIKTVTIGKRILKEVKIYPLSIADQTKMSDLIAKSVSGAFGLARASDTEFIKFIQIQLQDNLEKVLELITDEGSVLLEDITNEQAIEIGNIVYEVNYDSLKKKLAPWLKKMKGSGLAKWLPASSDDTPNSPSTTSSEEVTEKVD